MPVTSKVAAKAVHLLGKRVRLDLGSQTVVEGKLLAFADDGSVTVQDSEGALNHCWPMLDIVECTD